MTAHRVDAELVVLHGQPAKTLESYAAEHGYEVLAVGSHGRGMSRAILGSVAAALLQDSRVPIVITGRRLAEKQGSGRAA